jgi:diaminopropionate ammonia-lyase
VIDGYGTMFAEADEQGANPTRVVIQMGVGALTAAAVTHYRPLGTRVGVVEPVDAACGLRSAQAGRPALVPGPHRSVMAGLNCGAVSLLAWPIIAAGVDVFVTVSDADAEQAVRDLAGIGIRSGETGAAGLAGVRALADARPDGPLHTDDRVLIVCTEGPTDPAAFWRITGQDG